MIKENLNFKVLNHASVVINNNIYVDPYEIEEGLEKARVIFITHSHYDHLSLKDIEKIYDEDTIFVCTRDSLEILLDFGIMERQLELVEPDSEYEIEDILVATYPAYNKEKEYHKKSSGWVGYLITIGKFSYYICGDTDNIPEFERVQCDVLFVPIGGEFTMDLKSAVEAVLKINPKIAVPIHYGSIVGERALGQKFKAKLLKSATEVQLFIE